MSIIKAVPRSVRHLALATLMLCASCGLAGQSVTLAWNSNQETNLAGYRLYHGPATRSYVASITVDRNTTQATVTNLMEGQTIFFAVTAFTEDGLESDYSDEVSYSVPAPPIDSPPVDGPPVNNPSANTPPVAHSANVVTSEDRAMTIVLGGSDADGDPLTYAVVTPPARGTLSGTAPNLVYTPALNANGNDSLTFQVSDGRTSSPPATISVTITPVNDRPEAQAEQIVTLEDQSVPITLHGIDIDGDPLTYSISVPPTRGTLSGTAPNLVYTPNPNANGDDSLTFRVRDGRLSSTPATISITITPVNDPPVAQNASVVTPEDQAVAIVLGGSDPDGDPLTYSLVTSPTRGTLSGSPPNLVYTPALNANGIDALTFQVSDGQTSSAPTTISISITPVNDPPVAGDDTASVAAGSPLTLPGSSLLANDRDDEPGALSITGVSATSSAGGSVTWNGVSAVYLPRAGFSGTDTFSYTIRDTEGLTAVGRVVVTVRPGVDLTGPVIDGLGMAAGDTRTIKLSWTTDEPALCLVEYGTNTALGKRTTWEVDLQTVHEAVLKNLSPATEHVLRIRAIDANDNASLTGFYTATTLPATIVAWSAESGTLVPPLVAGESFSARDGGFVMSPIADSGAAIYPLEIRVPSEYRLWCRVWLPPDGVASGRISVEDRVELAFDLSAPGAGAGWRWVLASEPPTGAVPSPPRAFTVDLPAGSRPWVFRPSTAGTLFDEFVLANDPDWRPENDSEAPTTPGDLVVVTSPIRRRVDLTWTDLSTNEEGFIVERSDDGVTFELVQIVPANYNNAEDRVIDPGWYTYRVRAFNATGESAPTKPLTGRVK